MITVPEGTKKIVERSRYLSEALSKKIINLSSLARYIKPELEAMLIKDISHASIVMALKRLEKQAKPEGNTKSVFTSPPEMMIRSGIFVMTLQRTKETEAAVGKLFLDRVKGTFSSITIGATEIQIAGTNVLRPKIMEMIDDKYIVSSLSPVSQITIYLPQKAMKTSGIYYFFLKSIAWEGINIIGVAATNTEFTLFFEDKNVNRAFEILTSLFTEVI